LAAATDLPEYHELPFFKIDLDKAPAERFVEPVTVLRE